MRTNLITPALIATLGTEAYSNEECDILASLEADPSSVSNAVSVFMAVCSIVSDHNEVHQSRKARSLVFEIGSQK